MKKLLRGLKKVFTGMKALPSICVAFCQEFKDGYKPFCNRVVYRACLNRVVSKTKNGMFDSDSNSQIFTIYFDEKEQMFYKHIPTGNLYKISESGDGSTHVAIGEVDRMADA